MKADYYLTLHCGLLATTVYRPRAPEAPIRMSTYWSVPVTHVLGDPAGACATETAAAPATWWSRSGAGADKGLMTSTTPLCVYRLSLHL